MQAMAAFTQSDHPILGRPFFRLHPCRTAGLMAALTASGAPVTPGATNVAGCDVVADEPPRAACVNARQMTQQNARAAATAGAGDPDTVTLSSASASQQHYVKAWISLMGPAVGLSLPHTYYERL